MVASEQGLGKALTPVAHMVGTVSVETKTILHYTLLEELGSGGMGVVYRARDTKLERTVALKFLPREFLAETAAHEHLMNEARAAAQLDHPNIGTIYTVEEAQDQLFIVMAYYQGQTLAERLEDSPKPWQEAVGFAVQIAKGLEHAHAKGIIHRDIKPGNLMLSSQGLIKILDFGLAALKGPNSLVAAGATAGTVTYMPPEQLRGHGVDERADVWALGTVLFEMLTGKPAFGPASDPAGTMLNILNGDPALLAHQVTDGDIPKSVLEKLDVILGDALAKEPAERTSSVTAFAGDLLDLLQAKTETLASAPSSAFSKLTPKEIVNNLPTPAHALVSRENELALISTYLQDENCRLLTLLGPGGTGKTRLSLEAAHEQVALSIFEDGVYFVALDALDDAKYITTSIAEALELELKGRKDPLTQISEAIATKRILLVLDNFEHIMEGATLPADLLRTCPDLMLLVTSRERLNLEEEWLIPLEGLAVPEASTDLAGAKMYGAVTLFKQRAQRVSPQFDLSDANLADVLHICRLVRGLPLGIELAAAWVRLLTPADIVSEMQQDYDFLESASRNVTERHRTLRAVFDYSWRLLNLKEQQTLRHLAVFRGGISKEALKAVTGASLATLASLVDKTLLQMGTNQRFIHHPVLLPYAVEKLAEDPQEEKSLREKHGRYFLDLVAAQGKALRGAQQKEALKIIDLELENIRPAWRWAAEQSQDALITQVAEALRLFYDQRGLIQEGLDLFTTVIEEANLEGDASLGHLKVNRAYFYILLGHYDQAEKDGEEGLSLLRPLQDASGIMSGLNALASVQNRFGRYDRVREYLFEGLMLAEQHEDKELTASFLSNLGLLESLLGKLDQAKDYLERGLLLARETSNYSQTVFILNNLGNLALGAEQSGEAKAHLEEGLALAKDLGMQRLVPFFLANLGIAAHKLADYDYAVMLCEEALGLVRRSGERWFEAGILTQLAKSSIAQADYLKAERHLKAALDIAWAIQDIPLILHTLIHYGHLKAHRGEVDKAIPLVRTGLCHTATNQEDKEFAQALLERWEVVDIENPPSLAETVARLLA